jgi:hypothetical protein
VQKLDEILPGAGQVKDTEGNMSLLKHVLPVHKESEEPKAAVTFAPTGKKPVPRTLRVNKGKPPVAPRPAEAEPEPAPAPPSPAPVPPVPAPSDLDPKQYGITWVADPYGRIYRRGPKAKDSSWAITLKKAHYVPKK